MYLALPRGHMGPLKSKAVPTFFFQYSAQPKQALESDYLGSNPFATYQLCNLGQAT